MEIKFRSNTKKKFLVDDGILNRLANEFHPDRRHDIDADEVFGLIAPEHQINSIHSGKYKTFTALNQQFF